jgi:hypothetical protein
MFCIINFKEFLSRKDEFCKNQKIKEGVIKKLKAIMIFIGVVDF